MKRVPNEIIYDFQDINNFIDQALDCEIDKYAKVKLNKAKAICRKYEKEGN